MPVFKEMPENQFLNVIRWIKRVHVDHLPAVREQTFATLKRLKVKRNLKAAFAGIPTASDQGDIRSVMVWMGKIEKADAEAIKQLVAIDATVVSRLKG
jgi:hypothetical protein